MTGRFSWAGVRYWDIDLHGLTDTVWGAKVFVDGEEQRAVRAFNVDEGWVRRLVLKGGQAQVDERTGERPLEEVVRGEVVVIP